jgi:uncharacterized membrane protein (DUF485 family)
MRTLLGHKEITRKLERIGWICIALFVLGTLISFIGDYVLNRPILMSIGLLLGVSALVLGFTAIYVLNSPEKAREAYEADLKKLKETVRTFE